MRATLFICLLALLAVSACSSETGILVTTTRAEGFTRGIDFIRIYVGQDVIATVDPRADSYFADENQLEDIDVSGRDLFVDPYQVLVKPAKDLDTSLVVGVVAFSNDTPVGIGTLPQPVQFIDGKVLEWELVLEPFDDRGGFVTPTGCLKYLGEDGSFVHIGVGGDADCDGAPTDSDCDDYDPKVSPNQPEDCSNGIDDNCNGKVDLEDDSDADNDGFTVCGGDCDDSSNKVNPDADEICDGLDNDCNGVCDDQDVDGAAFDADGDGYTVCGSHVVDGSCEEFADGLVDCDDKDDHTNPRAEERCDGLDNDCDGLCDNDSALDVDRDGYTECGSIVGICGREDSLQDCAPEDAAVHPGAQELCDGVDNNCDNNFAESTPCLVARTTPVDACVQGERSCTESEGSFELGTTCVPADGAASLDQSACDFYDSCQDSGLYDDPWQCVLDESTQNVGELCKINYDSNSDRCEGNAVFPAVPDPAADQCVWSIIGGREQQGYRVQLRDATGTNPAQVQSVCDVMLQVDPLDGAGTAYISLFFSNTLGVTTVVTVELLPSAVDSCDNGGVRGLQCQTWQGATVQPAGP